MNLMNPEYNILRVAGSSSGLKHSEDTLEKFRGRKLTFKQLERLKEHLTKHNLSEEQRAKARARMVELNKRKGIRVEVKDKEKKKRQSYIVR